MSKCKTKCPNCDCDVVDIVLIVDRSGSMGNIAVETIGALNAFIEAQKEVEGEAVLTLVLFDDGYEVLYDRVDIQDVEPITDKQYFVRGMTAMYDAIGKCLGNILGKNESGRVIVQIQSDGQENASKEFTGSMIKSIIKERESEGWDINFLGTGIDAIAEGAKFGLDAGSTMTLSADAAGMRSYSSAMVGSVTSYRKG